MDSLPVDTLLDILSRLRFDDVCRLSQTCRALRNHPAVATPKRRLDYEDADAGGFLLAG